MFPVVCCANADAQESSSTSAAPKNCLLIHFLLKKRPPFEEGLRSLVDSGPKQTLSAIGTPELTFFWFVREPLGSSRFKGSFAPQECKPKVRNPGFVGECNPEF